MKPGNRCKKRKVPIPAGFTWQMRESRSFFRASSAIEEALIFAKTRKFFLPLYPTKSI